MVRSMSYTEMWMSTTGRSVTCRMRAAVPPREMMQS